MNKNEHVCQLEIRLIDAAVTRWLRHSILLPHLQTPDQCQLPGDDKAGALHLGAYLADEMVGIASFLPEDFSGFGPVLQMRLRQMGVVESARNRGVGRSLFEWGAASLRQRGVRLIWCHARCRAFGFYERLGFVFHGSEFQIPEIGVHRLMYLRLT